MKVAIYSRALDYDQQGEVQQLLNELANEKVEPVIYQPFFEKLKSTFRFPDKFSLFTNSGDLDESIDCLISLGGDGTLLDTVTLVRDKNIPVLGINFGRLGFLASLGKDEIPSAVQSLVKQTMIIDKRSLIHLDANKSLFGDVPYGLNEFAIHKTDTSPMIKIHTSDDQDTYLSQWGVPEYLLGRWIDCGYSNGIYRIFIELQRSCSIPRFRQFCDNTRGTS